MIQAINFHYELFSETGLLLQVILIMSNSLLKKSNISFIFNNVNDWWHNCVIYNIRKFPEYVVWHTHIHFFVRYKNTLTRILALEDLLERLSRRSDCEEKAHKGREMELGRNTRRPVCENGASFPAKNSCTLFVFRGVKIRETWY